MDKRAKTNSFFHRNIWWVTFLTALTLLILHSIKAPFISIDGTSLMLLGIMLVSPFGSQIRKLKFGDFEAEIADNEIQKIANEVSFVVEKEPLEQKSKQKTFATKDAITMLAGSDPVLALAKLRIEIEHSLKRLAKLHDLPESKNSLRTLIKLLAQKEVFGPEISHLLREVIDICNRAIHGEIISKEGTMSIIETGATLLVSLQTKAKGEFETGLVIREDVIGSMEVENYWQRQYRLTTITPLVHNPTKTVRELSQDELDDFLEGYNEYAEFIVELVPLDQPTASHPT